MTDWLPITWVDKWAAAGELPDQIKGETYDWCAIDELSNPKHDKPFVSGDVIALNMFFSNEGRKQMNPSQEKPLYGQAEVIDRHGKAAGAPAAKMSPEDAISALQRMGYGARMAWWRRNRPSLEQLAKQPAGLSASQQKAFDKRARKRAANLARQEKQG